MLVQVPWLQVLQVPQDPKAAITARVALTLAHLHPHSCTTKASSTRTTRSSKTMRNRTTRTEVVSINTVVRLAQRVEVRLLHLCQCGSNVRATLLLRQRLQVGSPIIKDMLLHQEHPSSHTMAEERPMATINLRSEYDPAARKVMLRTICTSWYYSCPRYAFTDAS